MNDFIILISLWLREKFQFSWSFYFLVAEIFFIMIFFRRTFFEKIIFVFGLINYLLFYVYIWLSAYYSVYFLNERFSGDFIDFLMSIFFGALKISLIFYFFPLLIYIFYYLKIRLFYKNVKYFKLYGFFILFFSFFSFFCFYIFSIDAADCEKLPSDKEKVECRQKL